jgi:pyruvate dehydrogenase E2 component (dihydrolipoamide acetyltransferase)
MAGDRQEFLLPTVYDGATRATLVRWFIELGDRVLIDRPVCLVDVGGDGGERLLELTSPYAGTIVALGAGTGDALGVGEMLLTVEDDRGDHQYSPLVRRLAEEFGVDLAGITGSGPHGRITRADVHRAAFPGEPIPGTETDATAATAADASAVGGDRETGLSVGAPPEDPKPAPGPSGVGGEPIGATFAVSVTADAGQLLRAHEGLADDQDGPVALDTLLVWIAAMAVRDLPLFAAVDAPVAVGFARLTDNRIVDATVSGPHDLALAELDRRMHQLTLAAQHGDTTDADIPARITVVDAGALGMTTMTPLLAPAAAATIAFGRPEPRPWVVDGAVRNGWALTATGTFDPASVDVALASLLLRRVRLYVEDPILAFAS